jgi:Ala-tRNA(Pro) deacylase
MKPVWRTEAQNASIESEDFPMIAKKLKNFLDERKIKYVTITHSPAYTAQDVAQSAHIPGRILAKTVMVLMDGAPAMAVLPANHRVLLDDLCELTETKDVRLAREDEFKELFPDCEPGAMPPFGNLYDMSVHVSPDLAEEAEIAFNAGSHTEIIKMLFHDYERLVKPQVARFTT